MTVEQIASLLDGMDIYQVDNFNAASQNWLIELAGSGGGAGITSGEYADVFSDSQNWTMPLVNSINSLTTSCSVVPKGTPPWNPNG